MQVPMVSCSQVLSLTYKNLDHTVSTRIACIFVQKYIAVFKTALFESILGCELPVKNRTIERNQAKFTIKSNTLGSKSL